MSRLLPALLVVAAGGTAAWFAAPHLPAVLDAFNQSETSSPAPGSPSPAPATSDADAQSQSEGEAAETQPLHETASVAGTAADSEVAPTFDIVRIGPDGQAVIAGRAEPGAEVEIRVGGRVVDKVLAGPRGQWVATPAEPFRPEDKEISLTAYKDGIATPSADVVLIAYAEPPKPQPPPEVTGEPPDPASPSQATPEAEEEAIAVLLQGDEAGSRVLQAPGEISGDGDLALMVVDYDERGKVQISGEAPPGAPVRVYIDNEPAAEVVTHSGGAWSTVLEKPLEPGTYTLRLDQIAPSGEPVARLETPFTRAGRLPAVEGDGAVDYVIVQPGNSLWRLSRRLFGSGFHHVHIYDHNKGQIRNPDLIYPGQVFAVPRNVPGAG